MSSHSDKLAAETSHGLVQRAKPALVAMDHGESIRRVLAKSVTATAVFPIRMYARLSNLTPDLRR